MRRRAFLGLAAASGWTACSRQRSVRSRTPVRVAMSPYFGSSAFYLAQETGLFEAAGFQVEVERSPGPAQTIPLLAGGKLDVSSSALSPALISAVARGGRVRIVACMQRTSPGCGDAGTIYGRRSVFPNGLADLRQLKGKRVAIQGQANIGEFWLDVVLETAGLSSDDVMLVNLRIPEALAALTAGKIDAMVGAHSILDESRLASAQVVRSIGFGRVLPNFHTHHVLFGASLLAGDPERGSRFLAAYFQAVRDFLGGKTPKFLVDFARESGVDPEVVKKACRDTFPADGTISPENLQYFIDWSVRKGYTQAGMRAEQLVDARFLERVQRGNKP